MANFSLQVILAGIDDHKFTAMGRRQWHNGSFHVGVLLVARCRTQKLIGRVDCSKDKCFKSGRQ